MLPIIFYDIPSELEVNAWSPNTWKARYALNIKGVPYKTTWVEFPDIGALAIEIGAASTGAKGDPVFPFEYTLPIIYDPNTKKVVSDSFLIAEYLDETYPNSPTLFPPGTKPLVAAFERSVWNALHGVMALQIFTTHSILKPRSKEYFRTTREDLFHKKIEEFSPASQRDADLTAGKAGLAKLDGLLAKNEGKFVLGNNVSFADCALAGWLTWFKTTDDGIWGDIKTWQDGRWATHLDNMKEAGYAVVN